MSWEIFRCNLEAPGDDCSDPTKTNCISEALYVGQTDALVAGGFLAAGYNCASPPVRRCSINLIIYSSLSVL